MRSKQVKIMWCIHLIKLDWRPIQQILIWENEFFSGVMMDEENVENCILCCQPCNELEKVIKVVDYENLKFKASKWKGLDKYSKVYASVEWEGSSADIFVWHKSCQIEICRERKLQQVLNRKKKWRKSSKQVQIEHPSAPPRKTTCQSDGITH